MSRGRSEKGYTLFRRKDSKAWYVGWTDGTGRRRSKKASFSRSVSQEIARSLVAEADRVRSGVVDLAEAQASSAARQAVSLHVEEWERSMKEKRRTAVHVRQSVARVNRLLELAGIVLLSDIEPVRIQGALAFVAEDSSPQTARHYLTALRMFVRWSMKTGRLTRNPILAVEPPAAHGTTFRRVAFTPAQLEALLTATEKRPATVSPLGSADRAMYYRVMAYTGLRKSEAASLTPESFDLDSERPTVTVEAGYSKRRRRDVLPLRSDVVAILRPWLATKRRGERVFPIPPHCNLHRIFQSDCKAAGITAGEGERLGVHSLRRFFITSVVRAAGLAVGQELARHSTPVLTKQYTDLAYQDHQRGLDGLPPVRQSTNVREKLARKAQ